MGDCLIYFVCNVLFARRVAPRLGLREPKVKEGYFRYRQVLGGNPGFRHFGGVGPFCGVWFV
jgi:hypothetical protein